MGACRSRPFWGRNLTFKKSSIFQPAQKEPNLRNLAPYEKLIFLQGEKNCHLAPDVSKKVQSFVEKIHARKRKCIPFFTPLPSLLF